MRPPRTARTVRPVFDRRGANRSAFVGNRLLCQAAPAGGAAVTIGCLTGSIGAAKGKGHPFPSVVRRPSPPASRGMPLAAYLREDPLRRLLTSIGPKTGPRTYSSAGRFTSSSPYPRAIAEIAAQNNALVYGTLFRNRFRSCRSGCQ